MELIRTYFPDLTESQFEQLSMLGPLYAEWNQKINVISRKDIDFLYEHHVLHSLSLAKYDPFTSGSHVLDAGTGGGFPGIPLAILYPEVNFHLLDSTAKKIHVVKNVSESLGLQNVSTYHSRLEEHQGNYAIILSRAVSTLSQLIEWTRHMKNAQRWIVLKGGDPKDFRKELPPQYKMAFKSISEYFPMEYYNGKWIVDVKKSL
jgi:16S rRNA (guanine527-N7)-methyltransferase